MYSGIEKLNIYIDNGRLEPSFSSFEWKFIDQQGVVVKNLPANAGDARDTGSIPGSGRSPGIGNGTPLQYSCLENFMTREAW